MLNLQTIHKPTTLEQAVELLQQPGTVALAGGTNLIAESSRHVEAVVDLNALRLAYIREKDGAVAIGATTTLADLAESPILRALANGVAAQAAHASAASILRNQGSIAGTLISEPGGILAVALLALDAQVTLVGKERLTVPLADLLSRRGPLLDKTLVTEITVPMTNPRATLQSVARTPSDKPIVGVCAAAQIARSGQDDPLARHIRIALGGVGETAVRATLVEQALEGQVLNDLAIETAVAKAAQGLAPLGDFRGSIEYRTEMAIVLTRRAVKELMA